MRSRAAMLLMPVTSPAPALSSARRRPGFVLAGREEPLRPSAAGRKATTERIMDAREGASVASGGGR
jgi:hypothetical protein